MARVLELSGEKRDLGFFTVYGQARLGGKWRLIKTEQKQQLGFWTFVWITENEKDEIFLR